MEHNVDLGVFGLCSIRCSKCGKDLDLSEVDIDCDVQTHHPMSFKLNLQCAECEEENEINFNVVEAKNE